MKIFAIALVLTIFSPGIRAAENPAIDIQKIADILGFPASELVLEEVTEREEKARNMDFESAYLIMGKSPNKFHPLFIYKTKSGGLNNDNYAKHREGLRNMSPNTPREKGGALGFVTSKDITGGFVTLMSMRVSSLSRPGPGEPRPWSPQDLLGAGMLATVPSLNKDIQIFMVGSGNDITPLPGAERYWENFHDRWEFDPKSLFLQLFEVVLHSPMMQEESVPSFPQENRNPPVDGRNPDVQPGGAGREGPRVAHSERKIHSKTEKDSSWLWLLSVIPALLATGYLVKRRFS